MLLIALGVALHAAGSNMAWFEVLNASARALPDVVWSWITILGTGACAYALITPALLRAPRLIAAALLTGAFAGLYTHVIKRIAQAPRPAGVLDPAHIHVIGETLTSNSFPSGHSVTAFAFAGVLACFALRPGRVVSVALPLAALVAFSRIAVGAHWPLDALAGAAGGWLCGVAGDVVSRRLQLWQRPRWQFAFAAAYIAMGIGLATSDLGYPQALPVQWLLALFATAGGLHAAWQLRGALRP